MLFCVLHRMMMRPRQSQVGVTFGRIHLTERRKSSIWKDTIEMLTVSCRLGTIFCRTTKLEGIPLTQFLMPLTRRYCMSDLSFLLWSRVDYSQQSSKSSDEYSRSTSQSPI